MNPGVSALCAANLYLVPILPDENGNPSKAPKAKGWNKPRCQSNPNGYSKNPADFVTPRRDYNYGLYHGASNTLALDLDDVDLARKVFEDLTDIQLLEWLENDLRFEVKSPKQNRGKLIFKLPIGFDSAKLRQLKHDGKVIFELRAGNCQDVIIGSHPEGGEYKLIGNPSAIPEAQPILLDMLQNWDAWKPCFESVLGFEQTSPASAPQKPQLSEQIDGWRNPIDEFNQSFSVEGVLIRNGYTPAGKDRFIRPGSESNAPGAVILRKCKDGIERVFSHGGDVLNDSFAHDAFDCYRILECDGDYAKALNHDPNLTRENQRRHMQELAKNPPQSPLLNVPTEVTAKPKAEPFPLVSAPELTAKPVAMDWLVEDIIEAGSLNLLFGEPGAGKSLFALDWAFCIAAGIDWHGYRTIPTYVVIIAGEGFAGMARRLKALELKHGCTAPANLYISQRPAQLMDAQNAQWIADSIKALCENPGLIIIDTLHRNTDADENSSQDIGKFISNLDFFMKSLGAAVLVVHHSGHGDKQRSRGSSSIRAAMDGEFSATKNETGITLTCQKAKDFEAFQPIQFGIKPVDLEWIDDDGMPLTSVYLEYQGAAKPNMKTRKLSARDQVILTSLTGAVDAHGVEPTQEIKAKYSGFDNLLCGLKRVVNIDYWRDAAYPVLDADTPPAKQKAFTRARKKLFDLGYVSNWNEYWWVVNG